MPLTDIVPVPAATFTALTANTCTVATLQLRGSQAVYIIPHVSGVRQALDTAIVLDAVNMVLDRPFADIWRGLSGVDGLSAWSEAPAEVWISHA